MAVNCCVVAARAEERLAADYGGTGVTVGPHPMALRRRALAAAGVTRAIDLARVTVDGQTQLTAMGRQGSRSSRSIVDGTRVRVAGSVIVRQRPGTAKGFV